MGAPVTPDDFKDCISDPSSGLCANFTNTLLKLPVLIWKLVNYLFDSSGNPTKAFVNQGLPPGSLVMSACLQTEDGSRLLCDGRSVAQATYPDLYTAIGATYGVTGAGNFLLPDFRARFPVGIGTFAASGAAALGVAGGEDKHQLTNAELSAHTHGGGAPFKTSVQRGAADTEVVATSNHGDGTYTLPTTASTGLDNAHNNLPPYLPCYIYIAT
jgi:microcystin-dependent protein